MKAIISPHDGGSIGGSNGCDAYCKKYGNSENFYSNNNAKSDYDNRLAHILNFESPHFKKKWSQLSEVILAFDLQNEPMINAQDKAQNNDPDDWLCGRAGNMKKHIGSSGVKVNIFQILFLLKHK
jgi:mannan endo-1,4-beta-mannosidase